MSADIVLYSCFNDVDIEVFCVYFYNMNWFLPIFKDAYPSWIVSKINSKYGKDNFYIN